MPIAQFGQEGWNAAAMYDVVATRYNTGSVKALVAMDTGLTNTTLPPMVQDLVATIPSLTSATTFTEAIGTWFQALISGECNAEEVIEEIAAVME